MLGVETEFAFTALDSSGAPLDRGKYTRALLERVKSSHPYLCGRNPFDLYLANGARIYVDIGRHPEAATPECTSPEAVVRFSRALEEVLARAARELETRRNKVANAWLFKCNVDYVSGATWGSHESYLYKRPDQPALAQQIIPHLVSRVIYTGAGGLRPSAPGIEFTLSPRVAHLEHDVSGASTGHRGIYHTKDEPLAGGVYHRLHVLSGESLCSQLADYLRLATTALIVKLCEAGERPGVSVVLSDPLQAMRAYVADPTCTARADLEVGPPRTALEIQRHYLEEVESRADAAFMPSWAGDACRRWRDVLDALEADPASMTHTLDWPMKLAIFNNQARQHGIDWDSLPLRNRRTAKPARRAILKSAQALRAELCEIDTRFGQLGPAGIFNSLDRSGVLQHRIVPAERITAAVHAPPADGRARLRGEQITRLSERRSDFQCNWQSIVDHAHHRVLDLMDPFADQVGEWEQLDLERPLHQHRLGRAQPELLLELLRTRLDTSPD